MGYIFPILESFTCWLQQWIETKKSALVVKQMKLNQEIAESQEPEFHTPVIGFQVNYDDDEPYPEEETEPDEN
jgi:hypothetical protein